MLDAALQLVWRVDQGLVHDRRTAVVRDAVFLDELEDRRGFHFAQADVGAGIRRHGPGKAPAVAVEHRQRPAVHRAMRHAPDEDVAYTAEIYPSVAVHDPFGIAGGARSVVERA